MAEKMTFNELRKLKDSLPDGTMSRIASELGIEAATVRNYFGGSNWREGSSVGIHLERGPGGGVVVLDDTTILNKARTILGESM